MLPIGGILESLNGRGLLAQQQVGEFVRERRKVASRSQKELGDLAGVGRRFVSELEHAKKMVRMNSVDRVLAVFGKTLGITDSPKDGFP